MYDERETNKQTNIKKNKTKQNYVQFKVMMSKTHFNVHLYKIVEMG